MFPVKVAGTLHHGIIALYAESHNRASMLEDSDTPEVHFQTRSLPAVKCLQPFSYEKENHEACTKACRDLCHGALPIQIVGRKYLTEHGQAMLRCSSKSGDSGGRLMEARAVIDVPSQDNPLAF